MKTYVFPGQGPSSLEWEKIYMKSSPLAKNYLKKLMEILGFRITDIMFEGTADEQRD